MHNTGRYKEIPILSPKDLARFWSYVDRKGLLDCWPWTGSTSTAKYGATYGVFRVGASTFKPHRIAWVLTFGAIDPSLTIDHTCQMKLCANPAHMELVPLTENVRRREAVRDRTKCRYGHSRSPKQGECGTCASYRRAGWRAKVHGAPGAKPAECRQLHPHVPLFEGCPTCTDLMHRYRQAGVRG